MFQRFFDLPEKPGLPPDRRRLYQLLAAIVPSISLFQSLISLGIVIIATLGLAGYFDTPENIGLLFLVASINLLDSILHVPMFPLLRQEKLELVAILIMLVNGVLASAQILLWQGIMWFPLLMVISAAGVLVIVRGLSLPSKAVIIVIGILLVTAIIFADSQITYPRLSVSNYTSNAAFVLYFILTIAMILMSVLSGLVSFKTLQNRLIAILTTATIITIVVYVSISSLTNYVDSRKQALDQLETVSSLKAAQINAVLANLKNQANQPLNNLVILQRIQFLLTTSSSDLAYKINFDLVRSYLDGLQQQIPNSEYLLVDSNGKAIISTNRPNEKINFAQFDFMNSARNNLSFSFEKNFPGTDDEISLLVLSPVVIQKTFSGVLVFRTDLGSINAIAEVVAGTSKTTETYLITRIGDTVIPTTKTRIKVDEISTYPAIQTFSSNIARGSGTYQNYADVEVTGYFLWIPELQSALVSEIDRREILEGVNNALFVNLSIGALMIMLIIAIVLVTSRSISLPIQDFAQKANTLASGDLSIRIASERQDEIGALATSFNTMATELQTTVRTLEMKVEERTKDLQKQANYMRIASEVARDATTSQDPDELLNRAAQLILDRFSFYHTGIFLVDAAREYAVLRASPTEAGRAMLENGHRLKLGQVGLVGYVAATGTPRIALDTGQDKTYFNNPLLPDTRSEIAIPLKLDERVIGVLDVQSTQPEAFTQDDIATLQTMADQLALAIQRVELVKNLQRNLDELENTYKTFTADSWQKFSQEPEFKPGYLFDGVKITLIESFPVDVQNVLAKGQIAILPPQRELDGATVAAPLKLREQTIGVLTLRFQTPTIEPDVLSLIEETAGRLAVALENARLYAETQNLVQRERAVSEISSRITTSFNIENILRTAVIEIGKMNPDAEVVVQLEQNKD